MARKTEIVEVEFYDGETRRFELVQFKPRDGHAVLERLLRVAAPVLGPLAENLGAPEAEAAVGDLSVDGISAAFEAFADNIAKNEGVLEWLVQKVKKATKLETEEEGQFVSISQEQWDDVFAGEYGAELDLVVQTLKLNYRSLAKKGGGLGKLARRFVTPTRSRSSSPKGVPSGSGASS
jgi:hypothetical protein